MIKDTVGSIAGIMTSIAALAASICLLSSFSKDEGRELRPLSGTFPTKELNKTLDNDMSETPEILPMDRDITNFMREWQFQGAQVSVSRNDSDLNSSVNTVLFCFKLINDFIYRIRAICNNAVNSAPEHLFYGIIIINSPGINANAIFMAFIYIMLAYK